MYLLLIIARCFLETVIKTPWLNIPWFLQLKHDTSDWYPRHGITTSPWGWNSMDVLVFSPCFNLQQWLSFKFLHPPRLQVPKCAPLSPLILSWMCTLSKCKSQLWRPSKILELNYEGPKNLNILSLFSLAEKKKTFIVLLRYNSTVLIVTRIAPNYSMFLLSTEVIQTSGRRLVFIKWS